MNENVVSISGAPIESPRRAQFLQCIASTFDRYVDENGFEPDALCYIMCGLTQPSRMGWDITEGSAGGPQSIMALAAVHMMAEAQSGFDSRNA